MAYDFHPGECRKGKLRALPFLAIECPVCKAPAGKTCHFGRAGNFGFAHQQRREEWRKQKEKSSVA